MSFLKCILGHAWNLEGMHQNVLFEDSNSKFPYSVKTDFLFRCEKCNKIKIKTLPGRWEFNEDDNDEDDDGGQEHETPKVPDDFYDFMEKR